ncbi:MAG: TAXI family TRAP transporter solute-binding subunit [Synergistales bacterium]
MKKMRGKFLVVLTVVSLLAIFALAPAHAADQVAVRAAAGGVGGGWYTTLAGLAEIIANTYKEINVQVVPGAGLSNPPRVGEKEVEFCFSFPPFTAAAYGGNEPFPKKYDNLRGVAKGFGSSMIQFVIDEETGIKTFEDFIKAKKPLRIAVERNGTTDDWIFKKILAYYKCDYKTIESWGGKVTHAGYGDQAVLMKDRQVDAIIGNVAAPWTAVMEASLGRKVRILPLSRALIDHLQKNYALLPAKVKAGSYGFLKSDVPTVACVTQLICHKDVPDELVYKITKAICENVERVHKVHDAAKEFSPDTAWSDNGAPLHPGAAKYYKEKGLMKN